MAINLTGNSLGERLRCSFCGKGQDEVTKLIAGPKVFICNECVGVCVEMIADEHQDANQGDPVESERWRSRAARLPGNSGACSLCGEPTSVKEMLPVRGRGVLCGECADAIEDAIAEGSAVKPSED